MLHLLNRHCETLEILSLLSRETSATRYHMCCQLHCSQKGVEGSIRCLERMGLIERVSIRSRSPLAKPYRLTARGRFLVDAPLNSWAQITGP